MKAHECPATKVCNECGLEKPRSEYHKNSASPDGKKHKCKECEKHHSRNRYQRRREIILDNQAGYRKANKEKIAKRMAKYAERNKDKIRKRMQEYNARPEVRKRRLAKGKKWFQENKESVLARRKQYYEENPDKAEAVIKWHRQHYRNNKSYYNAKCGKRRAAKVSATPEWADRGKILEFYRKARRLTRETGVKHVVDHIIPLQGKKICGLHVETNLQVITEAENLAKFNKFG